MSRIGSDVLLHVQTGGTPAAPTLEVVACQRDVTFTENTAVIDVSCKDQREQRVLGGRYSSEITLDSLYVENDDGYQALRDAVRNGELIVVERIQDPVLTDRYASALITSLSDRFPDQAESTLSATLVIDGPWRDDPAVP
jgi:TP901-1 family phage major tail protein